MSQTSRTNSGLSPTFLRDLRKALAAHYTHVGGLRILAADAGLTTSAINFIGSTEDVAFHLLEEARKGNGTLVKEVINVAKCDFPSREEWPGLWARCQQELGNEGVDGFSESTDRHQPQDVTKAGGVPPPVHSLEVNDRDPNTRELGGGQTCIGVHLLPNPRVVPLLPIISGAEALEGNTSRELGSASRPHPTADTFVKSKQKLGSSRASRDKLVCSTQSHSCNQASSGASGCRNPGATQIVQDFFPTPKNEARSGAISSSAPASTSDLIGTWWAREQPIALLGCRVADRSVAAILGMPDAAVLGVMVEIGEVNDHLRGTMLLGGIYAHRCVALIHLNSIASGELVVRLVPLQMESHIHSTSDSMLMLPQRMDFYRESFQPHEALVGRLLSALEMTHTRI